MVCRQVRERQMTRLPDTLSPGMIHIADRASEEEYRERCEAIVAVNESGNFQVVELDPDFRESGKVAGAAASTERAARQPRSHHIFLA